jgi:HK97 family phage portal protein
MAGLPCHVYRDLPEGGKEKAIDADIYNLLHRRPNSEQTAFIHTQTGMAHELLYGDAYDEIEFDNLGKPVALWPIPPWVCNPMRTPSKELFYRVYLPDGPRDLQPYRVVHHMGFGTDGERGLSPIQYHAETLGISLATNKFRGYFYSNGLNVGGILEHPNHLSDGAEKNLRKTTSDENVGLDKSHRFMLLEEGMKYQKIGINPVEAQLMESLQWQVEDIARIYGVQLHKIGHLLRSTNNNIEHQGIEFVTDTMLPHAVNWEQEYDNKLCYGGLYTKHSMEGLLRGDSAARAAFYRELYYLGAICADEIRESEEKNPIPGGWGKRFFVQGNLVPVDKVDEYLEKNAGKSTNNNAVRALMTDAVRRIAEREKRDILRQVKKNPDQVNDWLMEFYRDFREFIIKQVEPALDDRAGEYADRYITQSKRDLEDVPAAEMEERLANWETGRPVPSLTGIA